MIVLDTETTGTNPHLHSILSIGAIDFNNPTNQFYGECTIWEGAHIEDDALKANHFTREDIADPQKQSLEILLRGFFNWVETIKERTIAGTHVGYFDLKFIEESSARLGINFALARRTLDLHSITYMHMTQRGISIPRVNNHSGIDSKIIYEYVGLRDIAVPHHALEDAKLEAEAFSRLLYGKKLLEEFKDYEIPSY